MMPVVARPILFHVGTLDATGKGSRGASLEGTGLSVSRHPESWTAIAKLGGQPVWRLERPAARFLDFHRLDDSGREALTRWGVERGFLVVQQQWEVSWFDDELDARVAMRFRDEIEARREFDGRRDDGDDAAGLVPLMAVAPTAAVTARLGFATDLANALDIAATLWVEDDTNLDGVWWNDRHDVASLSAPRGVIVPRALADWTCARRDDSKVVHVFGPVELDGAAPEEVPAAPAFS